MYASSKEIHEYFKKFQFRFNLDKVTKLQHEVSEARWDDDAGKWHVKVKNLASGELIEDSCDVLINAGGILNAWRWPAIPGLNDYKGPLLHSANWDDSVDFRDKHVGLIGNG